MSSKASPSRGHALGAIDVKPMPLRAHEGEDRYQAKLDSDYFYRMMVLGALLLALFAGSGFGELAANVGWLGATLWSVTAAGFAARCVCPRAGLRSGGGEPSPIANTSRFVAILILPCAGLVSLRSGTSGLYASVAALGAAGGFWLTSIVAGARGRATSINPVLALTRISNVAWVLWTFGDALHRWQDFDPVSILIAGAAAVALDGSAIKRMSFVATVAVVAAAHLANLLAHPSELSPGRLGLQFLFVAMEYIVLIMAGLRQVLAQPLRLPRASYRMVPLCIVPRLDRAWDYPVKISVI